MRTRDDLRRHYEIERELADRLRKATRAERLALYPKVYAELFERVPDHPQLTNKADAATRRKYVTGLFGLIKSWIGPDSVYLEIGAGDCRLAMLVAEHAARVVALDVTDAVAREEAFPANFQFRLTNGLDILVEPGSCDIAYSNQVMEHLHPDDAREQLINIARALKPGGVYICLTPNRVTGPADISKYFDDVARGFHLKEYTIAEISGLFREAGFGGLKTYIGTRGFYMRFPRLLLVTLEGVIQCMPHGVRRLAFLRPLFGITLAGTKRPVGGK